MILTCPACATRYQADEAKFPPDGRQVRCAKCGNVWHQPGPQPEAAPLPAAELAPEPVADVAAQGPVMDEPLRPRTPLHKTPPPQKERQALLPMLGVALGWICLIGGVLLIGLSAVRYREDVIVIWPQSRDVYARLGMDIRGIDFVHVDYHRESEDGQVVLAVTGRIVNNGTRELPVPQSVRVTLSDASHHELYHWNFAPDAQSLRPGQSIPFLTRLSSPPATARNLEVRFSKDGK